MLKIVFILVVLLAASCVSDTAIRADGKWYVFRFSSDISRYQAQDVAKFVYSNMGELKVSCIPDEFSFHDMDKIIGGGFFEGDLEDSEVSSYSALFGVTGLGGHFVNIDAKTENDVIEYEVSWCDYWWQH